MSRSFIDVRERKGEREREKKTESIVQRIIVRNRFQMMRQPIRTGFDDILELKDKREHPSYFFGALIVLSYFLVVLTFPLSLCFCLKVSETIFRLAFCFWYIHKEEQNEILLCFQGCAGIRTRSYLSIGTNLNQWSPR